MSIKAFARYHWLLWKLGRRLKLRQPHAGFHIPATTFSPLAAIDKDPDVKGTYLFQQKDGLWTATYANVSDDELAYMQRLNPHIKFVPFE